MVRDEFRYILEASNWFLIVTESGFLERNDERALRRQDGLGYAKLETSSPNTTWSKGKSHTNPKRERGMPQVTCGATPAPSLTLFDVAPFWNLPRRGRTRKPRATPRETGLKSTASPEGAAQLDEAVSPFQVSIADGLPGPRALPWADLWLPLRGDGQNSATSKLTLRVGMGDDSSCEDGSCKPNFLVVSREKCPKLPHFPKQTGLQSSGRLASTCCEVWIAPEAREDKGVMSNLFEISRRRTWPFHIHNPERTSTGRKTNRTAGAYFGISSNGL